jgi:phage terminase large subunit
MEADVAELLGLYTPPVAPIGPYKETRADDIIEVEELMQLPEKAAFLFEPHRYKVIPGGRGGSRSWSVARALLLQACERPLRILCAREFQVSISESVLKLLSDQIALSPNMRALYTVQKRTITNDVGSEFYFVGIRNNVTNVKSFEGIDICWVEEAEKVSKNSWKVLIPTIRKPKSEIWVTFNPDEETDPTSVMFLGAEPPPGAKIVWMGWQDNPWFPEELRVEKDYMYRVDPEAAEHVWGGGFRKNSAAQVLRGKYRIEAFVPEPDWDGPYYGADFGFSVDPSTLVKLWIHENKLYIEEEAYGVGVETDELPTFYEGGEVRNTNGSLRKTFKGVTGCKKRPIRADSARPETISYLNRHGFGNVRGATKGAGSVEDGTQFIKSFETIIIHTRCTHAAEEARLWSYKVDRLSKEPTNELDDKHNHIWDAVRYALEPLLNQSSLGMLTYMKQLAEDNAKRKEP